MIRKKKKKKLCKSEIRDNIASSFYLFTFLYGKEKRCDHPSSLRIQTRTLEQLTVC